jgi:hypothetical protein
MADIADAYHSNLKNRICSCRDYWMESPKLVVLTDERNQKHTYKRYHENRMMKEQGYLDDYKVNRFGTIPNAPRDLYAHNSVDIESSLKGIANADGSKRIGDKPNDVVPMAAMKSKLYDGFQFFERPRLIVAQPFETKHNPMRPLRQ